MTLAHTRRGAGDPLVLLHGLGSRKEVWNPVLDLLAEHRDVIAVDLPGFGDSPYEGASDVASLIDSVEQFLTELGIERAEIAGNSMGGGIALELARRGRASRVVAISPIGFWSTPERIWCQRLLGTSRALGRAAGPLLRPQIDSVALAPMFAQFYGHPQRASREQKLLDLDGLVSCTGFDDASASFARYDFVAADELRDIPVTVAWGTRDAVLFHRTQSRRARSLLPDATHITLTGLGHVPFSDDPRMCSRVILDR